MHHTPGSRKSPNSMQCADPIARSHVSSLPCLFFTHTLQLITVVLYILCHVETKQGSMPLRQSTQPSLDVHTTTLRDVCAPPLHGLQPPNCFAWFVLWQATKPKTGSSQTHLDPPSTGPSSNLKDVWTPFLFSSFWLRSCSMAALLRAARACMATRVTHQTRQTESAP